MARQRTGSLFFQTGTWWAKFTVDLPDGTTSRESVDLETDNKRLAVLRKAQAKKKLEAEGKLPTPKDEAEAPVLTFDEAVEYAIGKASIKDPANRKRGITRHASPLLGKLDATTLKAADFTEVYEAMSKRGSSKQTITNLKWGLSACWKRLEHDGMIPQGFGSGPANGLIPKSAKVDHRERAVLTDDELGGYLSYRHPIEYHDHAVLERQVMCCFSRLLGGQRTREMLHFKWADLAMDPEGEFSMAWVQRAKGNKQQRLVIPAMLRPTLKLWWERQRDAGSELLFPVRKGAKRRGKERGHQSFADGLRRDLGRHLGLETWSEEKLRYVPTGRPMTQRESELLTETERTLPVDFHSLRRAYNQALADANVNAQQAQALAGHATMAAHERYLKNSIKARELPQGAQPVQPLQLSGRTLTVVGEALDDDGDDEPDPDGHGGPGSNRPNRPGRLDSSSSNSSIDTTLQAGSSAVELWFYTPAVAGSTPVPPTKQPTPKDAA